MLDRMTRKQNRIGELVQEKFALQLLYQRNAHHLQRSRGDIGLLEYNRDRLYERYEKWKNKTHDARQNILNLQGQILALQNNPPNIQQIGMVGYGPPIFYGRPGEDPEDWFRDMQRYGCFAIERYETQKKLKIELILNLHLSQHKEHNFDTTIISM